MGLVADDWDEPPSSELLSLKLDPREALSLSLSWRLGMLI